MITYEINPSLDDAMLNGLFRRAWNVHTDREFATILARSAAFVGAFDGSCLVGFANVATDGGAHAFLLDPTVDRAYRRRGIGSALVARAIAAASERGCEWVHVDYEPDLASFYARAGFRATHAGVIHLPTSPVEKAVQ